MDSLKVIPWHGETRTLFYVVDESKPEDEQPAVVFTGHTWQEAETYIGEVGGG